MSGVLVEKERSTNNVAVAKTAEIPNLCFDAMRRCQIAHKGRSKIRTSDITLAAPVNVYVALTFMQWPDNSLCQAFRTGVHWKMATKNVAVYSMKFPHIRP